MIESCHNRITARLTEVSNYIHVERALLKIKKNIYVYVLYLPRIFFQRKVCPIAKNAVRSAAHPGKNTANVSLSVVRGG